MYHSIALLLAVLQLGLAATAVAAEPPSHAKADVGGFDRFVTRRGDQLLNGAQPLRFISFNIPNLHYVEDNMAFAAATPWRLPNTFEIADALTSVRQMGGNVVRTYTLSVRRSQAPNIPVHVLGPGQFNEDAFRALDRVVQQANRLQVRLIIPLVDNWVWWGGRGEYAAFRGKEKDDFWTDPQLIADFKETIRFVVNRTNVYTGVPYKQDKAILAWETGNELECPPAWTHEIAAYIKHLDPNHLVVDGRHASRLTPAVVDQPQTDIVTTHHYPGSRQRVADLLAENWSLAKGKKAYFVGEFGFVDTPVFVDVFDQVSGSGISGVLIWSLRFHNRDGGFYWHSEPFGHGKYKAYHWPGFASGAPYDETNVLALMRQRAFALRGLPVPPRAVPAPPVLLPINSVAAISWQGSAGASAYDLERAPGPDGPWQVVARDVSDADVPYRPLANDRSAKIAERYFYRVLAKNVAGTSTPSNVVGSVEVQHVTLVDEMRDASMLHSLRGSHGFETDEPRKAKEDMHRLRGERGTVLQYRTPGPVLGCRIDAFFPHDVADFQIAVAADGEQFEAVPVKRKTHFRGQGEYGYWKPVEYSVEEIAAYGRDVRITFTGEAQVGRIEIDYGAAVK